MFSNKKVKIDKELYARIKKYAELAGYASTQELVTHALERQLAEIEESGESDEEILKKLKGLGYIN